MAGSTGDAATRAYTGADIEGALERLVGGGTLTRAQADAVGRELGLSTRPAPATRDTSWTAILSEVGGYVGAAFVFAAVFALAGPVWDDLSRVGQVLLLAVPAVLMIVAAVVVAASTPGRWTPHARVAGPRRRLISVLVVVAAALAASATAAALEPETFETGVNYARQGALTALTGLLVVAVGYALCRTALLHVATAGTATISVYMVNDWIMEGRDTGIGGVTGLVVIVLGLAWAAATYAGLLDERSLGWASAGVIVFIGAQTMILADWPVGYLVLAALAAAGLGGYVVSRDVAVLGVGTLTLAVVVPQAVIDFSEGALGAAGALLITGLSIVAASVLGLRLHRQGRHA